MKRIIPWLTLKSVPGIGNLLFMRLIEQFGSPDGALSAPAKDLMRIEGISTRLATAIARHGTPEWAVREVEQITHKGFTIITFQDPSYPELLRHIPDPPPVLYLYGHIEPVQCPIAVVGSRKATTYGRTATHRLCVQLAERGATVISGMARGIDTAAHEGALAGGGRTLAVLGSGLNCVYPPENRNLFHRIAENGCVVSEFSLDAPPEPHHFPMRNRIISGISLGTVVVEAASNSGSLITARLAAEQNREVFAVPGSIHAATARGTHDLIKQGAKLIENVDDILEEIAPQLAGIESAPIDAKPLPELSAQESALYAAMENYPEHIDTLAQRLGMEVGLLTGLLCQLELKGIIRQEPGKHFVRNDEWTRS